MIVAALAWPVAGSTADGVEKKAKKGETCGTIAGIVCDEGLWCDPEPGHCGGMDLAGVCVDTGAICTEHEDEVCGCDGVSYGNDCRRINVKQPKDHHGACKARKP